jgi:hypothetical protein
MYKIAFFDPSLILKFILMQKLNLGIINASVNKFGFYWTFIGFYLCGDSNLKLNSDLNSIYKYKKL